MRVRRAIFTFASVLAVMCAIASSRASAAPEIFRLHRTYTHVGFEVSYLILFRVRGRFDDFEGAFVVDREQPENNRADIIIKTASVKTGSQKQEQDIRGPLLFDSERFPHMLFHSRVIERGPDNTGHIRGDLTLRGVTRPVVLDFITAPGGTAAEKSGDKIFADGFKVTGKIKRSDFGMNEFVQPISDTVTLFVCYKIEPCVPEKEPPEAGKPHYNQ